MIITREIDVLPGVAPASQSAADHDGTAIAFSSIWEPDVTIALVCGVLGTSATAVAKIQESADGSTNWTDVAGAVTATAVKATDDGLTFTASGRTTKRYIRARLTVGTATSIAGAVILAKKRTVSA